MLRNQAGIHSVKVALLAERGVVEYDPAKWTPEKVIEVSIFFWVGLCNSSIGVITLDRDYSEFGDLMWRQFCSTSTRLWLFRM